MYENVLIDQTQRQYLGHSIPFPTVPTTGESIRQVKIVPAENVRQVQEILAASDWSIVIISILPFSLTGSRGEYLRVVGIHSDG